MQHKIVFNDMKIRDVTQKENLLKISSNSEGLTVSLLTFKKLKGFITDSVCFSEVRYQGYHAIMSL